MNKQTGVVLIVVLWVVSLLMILLVSFNQLVRVEKSASSDLVQRATARVSADAVLVYLAASKRLGEDIWSSIIGQELLMPLENKVSFKVIPESSFISLNGASLTTLNNFFKSGAAIENSMALAKLIVERRSGSGEVGQVVQPRPWVSVNELMILSDFDTDALLSVAGLMTVASVHDGVNPAYAAPALLEALYGSDISSKNISQPVARLDDRVGAENISGPAARRRALSGGSVEVFRVQVQFGESQKLRKIEATVVFEGISPGYRVLSWNEYNAQFSFGGAP